MRDISSSYSTAVVSVFVSWFEIPVRDDGVEGIARTALEETLQFTRDGVVGSDAHLRHHLGLGEPLDALKVLLHEPRSAEARAIPPRADGFLVKHSVAEGDDAHAPRFEHPARKEPGERGWRGGCVFVKHVGYTLFLQRFTFLFVLASRLSLHDTPLQA